MLTLTLKIVPSYHVFVNILHLFALRNFFRNFIYHVVKKLLYEVFLEFDKTWAQLFKASLAIRAH